MEQFPPFIARELRKIVATDTHIHSTHKASKKRAMETETSDSRKSVCSASASIWVENWLKTYLWKYAKARAAKVR